MFQSTPVVKPDTTANSSQPRRKALTPVPMETKSPSMTSHAKENSKVNKFPITSDQPQPRRVMHITTLTPVASENTPVEQQQTSSQLPEGQFH